MRPFPRALVLFVALAAFAQFGCSQPASSGPPDGSTITVGVDLPLSGADASDGVPTANAVKLAIRDANEGKLVPGFSLAVDVRDDAVNGVHDPAKGATNFRGFIADTTDLGVIGPLSVREPDGLTVRLKFRLPLVTLCEPPKACLSRY